LLKRSLGLDFPFKKSDAIQNHLSKTEIFLRKEGFVNDLLKI